MNQNEAIFSSLSQELASFIANLFIIEYGIVQKVVAKGVVEVQLSVVAKERELKVITCMLINIASNTLTFNVVPEKGDKVLVLFPRRFSASMCDVDKKDTIVDKNSTSYSFAGSFAILLNQFKKGKHKNFITFEKGALDAQLGFNKDEDKTTVNVKTTCDGDIEVTTPKITSVFDKEGNISVNNEKVTAKMTNDGVVTLENEKISIECKNDGDASFKNEKVTVELKNDGTISVTNGKTKIKAESSGELTLDADGGKLNLKNAQTSLKDVITELINAVDKLATAGSPASHTAVPGQMAGAQTKLSQLM